MTTLETLDKAISNAEDNLERLIKLGALGMPELTYKVKLKRRRWQIVRFFWHFRNGALRRYGYSWWQIWRMCRDRSNNLIK